MITNTTGISIAIYTVTLFKLLSSFDMSLQCMIYLGSELLTVLPKVYVMSAKFMHMLQGVTISGNIIMYKSHHDLSRVRPPSSCTCMSHACVVTHLSSLKSQ